MNGFQRRAPRPTQGSSGGPAFDLLLHVACRNFLASGSANSASISAFVQSASSASLCVFFRSVPAFGESALVSRQGPESFLNLFAHPFGAILRVHLRDHTSLGNLNVAQDGVVPILNLRLPFLDPIDAHLPQLPVVAQFRIVEQLLTGMSTASEPTRRTPASADSIRNVSV